MSNGKYDILDELVDVELERIRLVALGKEIVSMCVDGLTTDGGHHKQYYLEEILEKLTTAQELDGLKETFLWDDGVTP